MTETVASATSQQQIDRLADQAKATEVGQASAQSTDGELVGASGLTEKLQSKGDVSSRALINDPNYWVWDQQYDSNFDSAAYPELGSSAMAVSKSNPSSLLIAGLGSPTSSGSLTEGDGYVSVLLDTNGDDQSDFGVITPSAYMYTGSTYISHIYRFVGESTIDTGLTGAWSRTTDGWAVSLPWQSMGISSARYVMGLKDSFGDRDWSPNTYGNNVQLSGVVGVNPTAPPSPVSQQVAGKVPTKVNVKSKKNVSLPTTTNAGVGVRWVSQTKKVCKISRGKLVRTGKKGQCRITATAAGTTTRLTLNQTYRIRIK